MIRILIIEDDVDLAYLLKVQLQSEFVSDNVPTVADAVRVLSVNNYDSIILDLNLPNGKGITLVEKFEKLVPYIPITVLTGGNYSYSEVIRSGAQSFVTKPYEKDNLIQTIKDDIARHTVRSIFSPIKTKLEELETLIK